MNIPVTKEVSGLYLLYGAIIADIAVASITSSPGMLRFIVTRSVMEKLVLVPIPALWLT